MQLTLTLTKDEILDTFASKLGIDKASIALKIVDGDVIDAQTEESEPMSIEPPQDKFLKSYLDKNKLDFADAAKMTGLSATTIKRACKGYHVNSTTFGKLVRGLCMSDEEIRSLRKGMTRHQK